MRIQVSALTENGTLLQVRVDHVGKKSLVGGLGTRTQDAKSEEPRFRTPFKQKSSAILGLPSLETGCGDEAWQERGAGTRRFAGKAPINPH